MTNTEIFNLLLLAILISVVFYHFIFKGILKLLEINRIKKNGEKVLATIIETKRTREYDGETLFHAVYKYTTRTGQIMTKQTKYAKGIRPRVGKELTIYYLPGTPEKYYISRLIPYEVIPIMLATPGVIFCLFELLKIAQVLSPRSI